MVFRGRASSDAATPLFSTQKNGVRTFLIVAEMLLEHFLEVEAK